MLNFKLSNHFFTLGLMPLAYRDKILSSRPGILVWRLGNKIGSKVDALYLWEPQLI